MAEDYAIVSNQLADLQAGGLTIIRLAEPITTAGAAGVDAPKRSSDASNDARESNPSPASLAADLAHYKELFSKLRFSYLEQVTKEKFLRAIVGDPPEIIEHQENVELEERVMETKKQLKAQKIEVARMVEQLETQGLDLSKRYETILLRSTQLSSMPSEIISLEESLAALRAEQATTSANPSLALPLPATLDLISQRQAELDQLNQQLKILTHAVPRKTRELERLQSELRPLEMQRAGTVAAAREAQRRKEEGERGIGDDLEMKGRWYRSVEAGLKDMLNTMA